MVVIGAGIMGSAVAMFLSQFGARVTVIDQDSADRASTNSFAWLNANWKDPLAYHRLNHLSLRKWHVLDAVFDGKLKPQWGGSLEWHNNDNSDAETKLRERVLVRQQRLYPATEVDRSSMRQLLPGLSDQAISNVAYCVHNLEEGAVDASNACRVLLNEAVRLGAVFKQNCTGMQMPFDMVFTSLLGCSNCNSQAFIFGFSLHSRHRSRPHWL